MERDRVVPYVIDNIIIHINSDGDSSGDGERESNDTKDRSDCSSTEGIELVATTVIVM